MSGLTKSFEDQKRLIFKSLDAEFKAGKVCVILGKSGVGKSSLLNLIAGIDLPDEGRIVAGETVVSGLDDAARSLFRRRNIGFVFQSFNLIPVLSVLENVMLVGQLDGRPDKDLWTRGEFLLKTVGLWDRRGEFPDRLSGGEQQRVALARALINDPAIILADEPTGNLDQKTGTAVLELIADQARRLGKTLIMVTHSPDAMAWADEVYTLENYKLGNYTLEDHILPSGNEI